MKGENHPIQLGPVIVRSPPGTPYAIDSGSMALPNKGDPVTMNGVVIGSVSDVMQDEIMITIKPEHAACFEAKLTKGALSVGHRVDE